MTDRELMQMALEALETLNSGDTYKTHNAAAALRQALSNEFNPDWNQVEALQESLREHMAEIQRLRQALAQPEQESVICRNIYEVWAGSEGILKPLTSKEAYLLGLVEQMRDEAKKGLKPLYTAPPKREWVGLTDEEVSYCRYAATFCDELDTAYMAELIEEDLKEKNHG